MQILKNGLVFIPQMAIKQEEYGSFYVTFWFQMTFAEMVTALREASYDSECTDEDCLSDIYDTRNYILTDIKNHLEEYSCQMLDENFIAPGSLFGIMSKLYIDEGLDGYNPNDDEEVDLGEEPDFEPDEFNEGTEEDFPSIDNPGKCIL